jgi:hypothetical protein
MKKNQEKAKKKIVEFFDKIYPNLSLKEKLAHLKNLMETIPAEFIPDEVVTLIISHNIAGLAVIVDQFITNTKQTFIYLIARVSSLEEILSEKGLIGVDDYREKFNKYVKEMESEAKEQPEIESDIFKKGLLFAGGEGKA